MKRATLSQLRILGIRKVFYSDTFLYGRCLLPINSFKKALALEGLDAGNKVTLDRCVRAILWSIIHGNKPTIRGISKTGQDPLAKTMTNMPECVSHVAIVKLFQKIETRKLAEIVHQISKGYATGARSRKKRYENLYLMDTTVLSNGHARKGKKQNTEQGFPFTKLCTRQLPQTYLVNMFFTSHDHSEKEPFETLIDWDKPGKTYVFDLGHHKLSFYGKITETRNFYVSKLLNQFTKTWHYNRPLSKKKQKQVGHYIPKMVAEATLGGKRREKDQQRVKMVYVQRVKPVPHEEPKHFWIITNNFTWSAKRIVEYWDLRWQVETYYNWLKNTVGFQGTQWATMQGLTVFLLLTMVAMTCLLAWCSRYHGVDWWKAGRFSFGAALLSLCALVNKYWVYRTIQRIKNTTLDTST